MDDDFERLVLGAGSDAIVGAAQSAPPPGLFNFDSPSPGLPPEPAFLNEDDSTTTSKLVGKGVPAFLTDDGGISLTPAGPQRCETSSNGDRILSSPTAIAMSSAAHLCMTGEQGFQWDLHKVKTLGKGSFGCATLYKQSPGIGKGNQPTEVVVKDVNIQTMTNREEEMESVMTEVDVLRRFVGHPSVVQFVDFHNASDALMLYIVLEHCGGGDLGRCIEKAKPRGEHLPEPFVAAVLIQLMAALQFMHAEQHILHRDVKPQNVFLMDDGVTIRLGDFGIATLLGQGKEKAKAACGSPFYMAPELCEERAYDGGADVWSAGVLLYELMALERPFNAPTIPSLTQLITKGNCLPLVERSELPYSKELKDLVQSMLTVSPTARPTVRRLLRSTYVRQHLHVVSKAVLQTEAYRRVFGDEAVEAALPRCTHTGTDAKE